MSPQPNPQASPRQPTHWDPVAQESDLPARHVFHTQLWGVELALWRSDDGAVNAWENRCPHRSVRLTLGVNTGETLRCQYHGWQYRSGDGRCSVIPASSDTAPPASLCARRFAVARSDGYIWVSLDAGQSDQVPDMVPDAAVLPLSLRALNVRAGLDAVAEALLHYPDGDGAVPGSIAVTRTRHRIDAVWHSAGGTRHVRFWLQPASTNLTVVHATANISDMDAHAARRWHNRLLSAFRRDLERHAPTSLAPAAAQAVDNTQVISFLPPAVSRETPLASRLIRTTVVARWTTAEDIAAFRLALPEGERPVITAGAHVDVHTPNGLVRQYSLVNAPHERDCLVLGVKHEQNSRGGSVDLHAHVSVGDTLTVSMPRNHFALVPKAGGVLFAGGIGITPILAMAAHLQADGQPFALHYFARGAGHVAFGERLECLRNVDVHLGLSNEATRAVVDSALDAVPAGHHIYICGPLPLVDLIRERSREHDIAPDRVHFELFANGMSHDGGKPFRVRLQRSDCEFVVPAGVALSAAIRAQGVEVATSCEQGVCGSCLTTVVEGAPEHRDVYLTDEEKAAGRCLLPCVSRSQSELLVLDL